MKKVLLVCLALLLLQGVCWGESDGEAQLSEAQKQAVHAVMEKVKSTTIKTGEDDFYGIHYFYVRCRNESGIFDPAGFWSTTTDFTITIDPRKTTNDVTIDIQYSSDDVYHLENEIIIKNNDNLIHLLRWGNSSYGNQVATAKYLVTEDLIKSLKNFKGDLLIRLYYQDLTGQYYQDIKIKEKKVEDIKVLFSLIYPELLAAQ